MFLSFLCSFCFCLCRSTLIESWWTDKAYSAGSQSATKNIVPIYCMRKCSLILIIGRIVNSYNRQMACAPCTKLPGLKICCFQFLEDTKVGVLRRTLPYKWITYGVCSHVIANGISSSTNNVNEVITKVTFFVLLHFNTVKKHDSMIIIRLWKKKIFETQLRSGYTQIIRIIYKT